MWGSGVSREFGLQRLAHDLDHPSASNPILSSHFAKVGLETESWLPYLGVGGGGQGE